MVASRWSLCRIVRDEGAEGDEGEEEGEEGEGEGWGVRKEED